MTALNGNLFSAYAQASQAFFENAVALNQEMSRFANERLQADVQLLQKLSKCKNMEEVVSVEFDFSRLAAEADLAEMPKLMEQAGRNSRTMWTTLFEAAKTLPQAGAKT